MSDVFNIGADPLSYSGIASAKPPIQALRTPTTHDTGYDIGQVWVDINNHAAYTLVANVGAVATWNLQGVGTSGEIATITGGSGGAQVPDGAGNFSILGTANQITSTGTLNTLTLSVPTTFIAPGSIASTTTITSGTSLTATLGNITATNGNLVLTAAGNKMVRTSVASTAAAGANSIGTVTLAGGTATVTTTAVTTSSLIRTWRQTVGATGAAALGHISAGTIVNGTSFVINAWSAASATTLQATDVSVIGWEIIN